MKLRLKQVIRWGKYTVIIVVIIGGTIALVTYGRGYFYSLESGEITSGGLLTLDSDPGRADIYIDNDRRGITEKNIRLPSGDYTIELRRDGYRSWSKKLSIREATVTHARYPVLIPNSVSSEPVIDLNEIRFVSQSDNRRYIAVIETQGNRDRIRMFAADSPESPYTVLPESAGDLTVSGLTWAHDNSLALATTISKGSRRHYLFEPGEADSTRVFSRLNGATVHNLTFNESATALYGVTPDNVLQRFSLRNGPPRDIARGVVGYDVHDEGIYVMQRLENTSRLVHINDSNTKIMAEYDDQHDYNVTATEYQDTVRVLLHNTGRDQVTLISKNSTDSDVTTSLPVGAAERIAISPNDQYIVMYTGTYFTTYDLERDVLHQFELKGVTTTPHWYTNHHMLAVSKGNVMLFEFDGANREHLTTAESFSVLGNKNADAVYSIRRNQVTSQFQLQRTELK